MYHRMTVTMRNCAQEIRALGYANIVGALFNCYTTTGSFSRSAVNNSCGAQSRAQRQPCATDLHVVSV